MSNPPPTFTDPSDDALWHQLGQLRTSSAVAEARAYIDRLDQRRALWQMLVSRFWSRGFAAGLCASVVAAVFLTIMMQPSARPVDVHTGIGERRTITLADGSRLVLDTDTAVVVRIGQKKRHIELQRGRANFDVVHDPRRPFQVTAGRLAVTAIGTNFDVSQISGTPAVTLVHGRVAVDALDESARENRAFMWPGQRLTMSESGRLTQPTRVDLTAVTGWQEGRLDFTDETVGEAIEEANRYSVQKIRLSDRAVSTKRMGGSFRTGDVNALAAALCAFLDLKVTKRTEKTLVLDRVE